MSRLMKGLGLFVAVFALVAVAVLWRWEATARAITLTDVIVYLGLLPLVIFAMGFGLVWAWKGATPRHEAALAQAAERRSATAAPPPAPTASDENLRHARLQLLSAQVLCAAGDTPSAVLAAAAEGKPRPDLANGLRDSDGLAVLCARIPDLGTQPVDAVLERVMPSLQRQRPEWSALVPGEHVLRALAALSEPLKSALHALHPWAERLGAPAGARPTASLPAPPAGGLPIVRLVLGWPVDWNDFERELATAWARLHVAEHADLPATAIALSSHAVTGAELWLQVDQLTQTLTRDGREDLILLAAAHSDIGPVPVGRLAEAQRLFSSARRPRGAMPGEAAAALLLAPERWPADPAADQPPVTLHRAAVQRRDKSVDGAGRTSSQSLQDAATHALAAARCEPGAVGAVVCDADQHSPRGPEFYGAVQALMPQLDAATDVAALGTINGHIGAVDALLAVATAAQRARDDSKPCLAVTLGDPFMRLALVARPPQPEHPEPA